MKKLLVVLAFLSTTALSQVEDTIILDNVIEAPEILNKANQLFELADKEKVVNIIINSPGGAVYAGLQFINAMESAKSKGVKLKCYVPGMAASMAFQIYAHCDERYAFKYSLLLWHPVRAAGFMELTPQSSRYSAWALTELENILLPVLFKELDISEKEFLFHYINETMWTAESLKNIDSDFLTIVDAMPFNLVGIWHPGEMEGQISWEDFEIGIKLKDKDTKPAPADCTSCHKGHTK